MQNKVEEFGSQLVREYDLARKAEEQGDSAGYEKHLQNAFVYRQKYLDQVLGRND